MSPIACISFAPWSPIPWLTYSLPPAVGKCLVEHKADLRHALVKLRPALTNVLHKILDHVREHQLPLSFPPRQVYSNPWGVPQAVCSTTRHPPQSQPPVPPPSPPPNVCV